MGVLRARLPDGTWVDIPSEGSPGVPGPPGPQGEQGPPGTGVVGGTFTFTQATPLDTWVITHNMGYFPAVSVVDSAGELVEGDTIYTSANVVTLLFSAAFSGKAYLS
jgi:hypothetical protein